MTRLNPRQQEAVQHTQGALLVLAGAGSGKTSVITQKIAHLITQKHIPTTQIVAMTFTNKAAREMKVRIGQLLPAAKIKGLMISTFHQFGLRFLRFEIKHTSLKSNFSIMDGDDQRRLLLELMQKENLSDQKSKEVVSLAQSLISDWKNSLIAPEVATQHAQKKTLTDKQIAFFARLYGLYERHLRAYNAVDFDDLIVLPVRLLTEQSDIRVRWQTKIRYVLVDEYQDTNTAQYVLMKLLVGSRGDFTVVGDDDQSIYAWRGAKPENMALLGQDFAPLKVVKLEQNYRSTNRILSCANAVIANNAHLFEKALWSDQGQGEPIRVLQFVNEFEEAARIAREISTHRIRHSNSWDKYAILYRSNFQARQIETELRALNVPYRLSGGTSFFARAEIKDIMSYLRLILNSADDTAFLRIINTPKRGIGSATLEKLGLFAQEFDISLLDACTHGLIQDKVGARAAKTLEAFGAFVDRYARLFNHTQDPIEDVKRMLDETGYLEYVESDAKNARQAELKQDNIKTLLLSISRLINEDEDLNADADEDAKYLDAQDASALEGAIKRLILLDMLESQREEKDQNRMNLMTLHAAKGLEFDNVYMIGVEEDILPHKNALAQGDIEEERRLMYVGITRAKVNLTLSYNTHRRGMSSDNKKATRPSRFLEEMPIEHLSWAQKSPKLSAQEQKAVALHHIKNIRALLGDE